MVMIYSWDGKKIKYFCSNLDWGDQGECGGKNYRFAYENEENKIFYREYWDMIFNSPIGTIYPEDSYFHVTIKEEEKELRYNGDSLVKISSKYSQVREYLNEHFPDFQFQHASYYDINNDSYEDVVAYIYKQADDSESIEEPKILILFGSDSGIYKSLLTNEYMVKENNQGVKFEFRNSNLTIYTFDSYETEYGDGFNDQPEEYYKHVEYESRTGLRARLYNFRFDPKMNNLVLISMDEYIGVGPEYEKYYWKKMEKTQKENAVIFENVGL